MAASEAGRQLGNAFADGLGSSRDEVEAGVYAVSLAFHRERRVREQHDRAQRRRRFRALFFIALFVVLLALSVWRLGNPAALVQLPEQPAAAAR